MKIDVEIKKLLPDDVAAFRNLLGIFKEVFENKEILADNAHLSKMLSNPNFLVFIVKLEDLLIGGLTIYVLDRYYGCKPIAYIFDVGISAPFQGRGFGTKLISEVCTYCQNNGFEAAYVEAESDDLDAVQFYRKTDFSFELKAIQFTYLF